MQNPNFASGSPHYLFHPDSPGYLLRKLERDEPISREELIRVFETNPGMAWDGPLFGMMIQVVNGTYRNKRGPKSRFSCAKWRCIQAWVELEEEEIREQRAQSGFKKKAADYSVSEQAYENVARALKLGSGKSLANELSSRRTGKKL
jgi:hypothetical protein